MTFSKVVAERILELCEERNITVNKLATLSGLNNSTVDNIVKGNSKNPKAKTLYRIAHGLDLKVSEFYDFSEIDETRFDDE